VVWRDDTEEGSHGVDEGVRREFRFWVMLSSMVLRERRRKSLNAVWLKQNCGVRDGGSYALDCGIFVRSEMTSAFRGGLGGL